MTARRWALPLVPLYWAGLRAKDALRAVGVLKVRRLGWPVLSVGSLSAGGAGKTPVVIALVELLRVRKPDILTRGYGRGGAGMERVDPNLPGAPQRFGDEPVLMARATGVPVWVGSERYAAGHAAEEAASEGASSGIHLLDDGFQHRQLARSFDIVLVTAPDLDDALLPAGNRREPLSALRRAHAIVLRQEEAAGIAPQLHRLLRPETVVWTIRRKLHLPDLASSGPLLAFSGIARPGSFVDTLKNSGAKVIDSVAFADHHQYTATDMRRLVDRLRSSNATAYVTTEKDAVKITPELRAVLEAAAPLLIARLSVEFVDPASVVATLEEHCR